MKRKESIIFGMKPDQPRNLDNQQKSVYFAPPKSSQETTQAIQRIIEGGFRAELTGNGILVFCTEKEKALITSIILNKE